MNLLISVSARCIAIKSNLPVPTITTLSSGLRVTFSLPHRIAMSRAQDKGALVSISI